jgi:hypothetical protein
MQSRIHNNLCHLAIVTRQNGKLLGEKTNGLSTINSLLNGNNSSNLLKHRDNIMLLICAC